MEIYEVPFGPPTNVLPDTQTLFIDLIFGTLFIFFGFKHLLHTAFHLQTIEQMGRFKNTLIAKLWQYWQKFQEIGRYL